MGEFFSGNKNSDSGEVVATFNDISITKAEMELMRNQLSLDTSAGIDYKQDIAVVNEIITNMILVEEAKKQGLSATDEEVNEMLANQKKYYEEYPESAKIINDYCAGAGIQVEEYWTILEKQLPSTISKFKLKDNISAQYREEHGIDKIIYSTEDLNNIQAIYEKYYDELLDKYKDKIVYYTEQ